MSEQIYLSRRNLLMLLSKLDRKAAGESTACTVIKYKNPADPFIQSMDCISVTAVEDDEYYANRNAGPMHPNDEVAVATKVIGQAMDQDANVYVYLASLPLGHHLYTGELIGVSAREIFNMDKLDAQQATITVVAPDDTYAISDSFWKGLLGDSLSKTGDKASAHRKLKFVGPSQFQQSFAAYITRHFIERGIK